MKIVVLTSETPGNVWLVNQVLARHDVAGLVIERRPLALDAAEKAGRRRALLARHGLWRTLNRLLYNRYRSRFLAAQDARTLREAFFPGGQPVAYVREVPLRVVADINDADSIEFIRQCAPEALAVCGTGVLREATFSAAPRGAINLHTGITPEYRSADPIFWALYRNDPEHVGVTVHFVDRGIDTGPIIAQEAVPVYSDDSLALISARCVHRGAELMVRALDQLANGSLRTFRRPDVAGAHFRSIDLGLWQYLLFRLRFRLGLARRLPRRPPVAAGTGARP